MGTAVPIALCIIISSFLNPECSIGHNYVITIYAMPATINLKDVYMTILDSDIR